MVSPSTFLLLELQYACHTHSRATAAKEFQNALPRGIMEPSVAWKTRCKCGVCREKCGVGPFQAYGGNGKLFREFPEAPVECLTDLLEIPVVFLREVLALRFERTAV